MPGNKEYGDAGERDVCELVACPNCLSKLMLLPPSFPMFDAQCTRCLFRAQIKTVNSKPKSTILGAGWDIYEKVLKAGNLPPPLIVNFKWIKDGNNYQEIRFYPFVSKQNVKKYILSETSKRANYRMFHYTGLDTIPYLELYSK